MEDCGESQSSQPWTLSRHVNLVSEMVLTLDSIFTASRTMSIIFLLFRETKSSLSSSLMHPCYEWSHCNTADTIATSPSKANSLSPTFLVPCTVPVTKDPTLSKSLMMNFDLLHQLASLSMDTVHCFFSKSSCIRICYLPLPKSVV